MVGPQMCGKSVTKSESERGKCQKRILRKGRMHERRMMIYFYFFAHKVYIAFNEDIKGSSTRPHILGTNGVG